VALIVAAPNLSAEVIALSSSAPAATGKDLVVVDPTTSGVSVPGNDLGDDDRTGLHVLYPDSADALHSGSISGKISPANPLALPASPPGVKGVFGAKVFAVDATNGAAMGATIGGWSCMAPGPAQFDGKYEIDTWRWGTATLFMWRHCKAQSMLCRFIRRLFRSAGIRLATRAGRRFRDAWCPRWTLVSRLERGPGLGS
jgi:hypothetical protein